MQGWDCHVHVFGASAVSAGAHYAPVPRPLVAIEALAQQHGIGHLVLVQPSVYGTDNSLVLQSLRREPGRHRGVVVLDASHRDESLLREWHAAGVRGVRFNLVSPVGTGRADALQQMRDLAPLLKSLGWHAQWYARAEDLPDLAALQQATGVRFVLDHAGGLTPAHGPDAAVWPALDELAGDGAWIKLSGWYRLQSRAPHDDMAAVVQRVAKAFGDCMVWGSDWPHTSFAPDALPVYDAMRTPVAAALGEARTAGILAAGSRLYA